MTSKNSVSAFLCTVLAGAFTPAVAQVSATRVTGALPVLVNPVRVDVRSLSLGSVAPFSAPALTLPFAAASAFVAPSAAPAQAAAPVAAASVPSEAAAASAAPAAAPAAQSSARLAEAAAPSVAPEAFWDGAVKAGSRPYWRDAFAENAKLLAGARSRSVPGLVSVSHFATRDAAHTPIPGLQIVLAPGAEPAAVLGRLAQDYPELKNYRALSLVTPGPRPVLYLARPARPASASIPKEKAARAADELENAGYWDALNIASGNKFMATRVDRLRKNDIELPSVFASRREVLRYAVLGEEPAAALKTEVALARALGRAIAETDARRLWNGFLGSSERTRRSFTVALSPEAPGDLALPSAVGEKTSLAAFKLTAKPVSAAKRRWRSSLSWGGNGALLALAGLVSFGGAPALARFAYDILNESPFMILNPLFTLGVPVLLITLLMAGFGAGRWTWRMARLYFSVR